MKSVGIRELKSKLSEYLRQVSQGEIIQVTDRGRVVAELRAPQPLPGDCPYPLLLQAAAEGKVRLPRGSLGPEFYHHGETGAPEGTALELLDWVRGER